MALEIRGPSFSVHSFNKGVDSSGPTTIYYVKANDNSSCSAPMFSIKTACNKCWKLNVQAANL